MQPEILTPYDQLRTNRVVNLSGIAVPVYNPAILALTAYPGSSEALKEHLECVPDPQHDHHRPYCRGAEIFWNQVSSLHGMRDKFTRVVTAPILQVRYEPGPELPGPFRTEDFQMITPSAEIHWKNAVHKWGELTAAQVEQDQIDGNQVYSMSLLSPPVIGVVDSPEGLFLPVFEQHDFSLPNSNIAFFLKARKLKIASPTVIRLWSD